MASAAVAGIDGFVLDLELRREGLVLLLTSGKSRKGTREPTSCS